MTRAVLSIGSNLGDRAASLCSAVAAFGETVEAVSPVYETPPWGDPDQPAYLNAAVLAAEPGDDPGFWLRLAVRAEAAAGRRRDPRRPLGPRTLDVDVIVVWDNDGAVVVGDDPRLTLPHPRAHLRAFVLRPWLDLQPDAELPGRGPVAELIQVVPVARDLAVIRRLEGFGLAGADCASAGRMIGVESTHGPGEP